MISMRKLQRNRDRWIRYSNRVGLYWRESDSLPGGLARAWVRYDRQRLRRNLKHFVDTKGDLV